MSLTTDTEKYTMSMSPETDAELSVPTIVNIPKPLHPHLSERFPSVPEHLESLRSPEDNASQLQRHLSDPGLPGS